MLAFGHERLELGLQTPNLRPQVTPFRCMESETIQHVDPGQQDDNPKQAHGEKPDSNEEPVVTRANEPESGRKQRNSEQTDHV